MIKLYVSQFEKATASGPAYARLRAEFVVSGEPLEGELKLIEEAYWSGKPIEVEIRQPLAES